MTRRWRPGDRVVRPIGKGPPCVMLLRRLMKSLESHENAKRGYGNGMP